MHPMTVDRMTCLGCDKDVAPGSRYFTGRVRFANGLACAECAAAWRADDEAPPGEVDRSNAFFIGNTGGYTGAG